MRGRATSYLPVSSNRTALQEAPIGIPVDNHFVPPPPALIVLGLAEGLLIANAVSQIQAGTYSINQAHYVVLFLATALPVVIATVHQQRGWLNQPNYHWP